jgi:hypothetical protein
LDTTTGALPLAFGAVGLSAWQRLRSWWSPFAALGVILFYGLLSENYESYLAVEGERDALKKDVETNEKRAAVGAGLQQLYNRGLALGAEVMNSTDETPHERMPGGSKSVASKRDGLPGRERQGGQGAGRGRGDEREGVLYNGHEERSDAQRQGDCHLAR